MASGIEPLNIPLGQVSDDTACKLGVWLIQKRPELQKYPEYFQVLEAHQQFHHAAGNVVSCHEVNNSAELSVWLPRLLSASDNVITTIESLEKTVPATEYLALQDRSFAQTIHSAYSGEAGQVFCLKLDAHSRASWTVGA